MADDTEEKKQRVDVEPEAQEGEIASEEEAKDILNQYFTEEDEAEQPSTLQPEPEAQGGEVASKGEAESTISELASSSEGKKGNNEEADDEDEDDEGEINDRASRIVMALYNYLGKIQSGEYYNSNKLKRLLQKARFYVTLPSLDEDMREELRTVIDKVTEAQAKAKQQKKLKKDQSNQPEHPKIKFNFAKLIGDTSKVANRPIVKAQQTSNDLTVKEKRPMTLVQTGKQSTTLTAGSAGGAQLKASEQMAVEGQLVHINPNKPILTDTGQKVKPTTLIYELYDMLAESIYEKDYRKLSAKEKKEIKAMVKKEGYIQRIYSEILNGQQDDPNSLTHMLIERIAQRVKAYKETGLPSVPGAEPLMTTATAQATEESPAEATANDQQAPLAAEEQTTAPLVPNEEAEPLSFDDLFVVEKRQSTGGSEIWFTSFGGNPYNYAPPETAGLSARGSQEPPAAGAKVSPRGVPLLPPPSKKGPSRFPFTVGSKKEKVVLAKPSANSKPPLIASSSARSNIESFFGLSSSNSSRTVPLLPSKAKGKRKTASKKKAKGKKTGAKTRRQKKPPKAPLS